MNDRDEFMRHQAINRDPVFSERIAFVGLVMLIVFLIIGLIFLVSMCIHIFGRPNVDPDGETVPLATRLSPLVFPVLWNFIVIEMLRNSLASLRNIRKDRMAQAIRPTRDNAHQVSKPQARDDSFGMFDREK